MDPELAAIAQMTPRLDMDDVEQARRATEAMWASQSPAGALEGWAALVEWRDEVVTLPGGREAPRRIYRPLAADSLSPAIVFIHGGGFITGNLETEHPRCMRYAAELRCVVVSLGYRLAPEHPYPAAFDDCYQGTAVVFERAADLGIDDRRIAIGGISAGGCLAAAVALRARDAAEVAIAYQFLLYPVLDDRMTTASMARFIEAPGFDARHCRQVWGYYLGESGAADQLAAPARASDLSGLPPTYLLVAEIDSLRDEALEYGARLLRAGVSTEIHQFGGTFHGFDGYIGPEISARAMTEQIEILRFALRP